MNLLETILHSYALTSVLLLVSYLVFRLCTSRHFKVSLSAAQNLRIAQVLLVAGLVAAPIAANFGPAVFTLWMSPRTELAPLDVTALNSPDEGTEALPALGTKLTPAPSSPPKLKTVLNSDFLLRKETLIAALSLGLLLSLGRLLNNLRSLRKLLSSSAPLRKVGKTEILVTDEVAIPFSTRVFLRAQVVVPLQLLESRKTLRIAIQHEIQHHRNGDTLWIILMELLGVAFYWNPAIYLWRRKMDELLEFSCDEALVTQRTVAIKQYGNCLIQVAENYLTTTQPLFGAVGMAMGYSTSKKESSLLHRRIQMIFNYQPENTNMKRALMLGGVALTTLLAFATLLGGKVEASAVSKITLEPSIERITNHALSEGVKNSKAASGYAIVTDPQTGRVLAISYVDGSTGKSLDTQKAVDLISLKSYQPNSLFKPITAAYALEHGKISAEENFNCENGGYKYGDHTYDDHAAFSTLSLGETLAHSSNIGAIKIAEKIGEAELTKAFTQFGFGEEETTSMIGGTLRGTLRPRPEGSSSQFVPEFAIGKNSAVTPLELTQAFGALANGGRLLKAQDSSKNTTKPILIRRVISTQTATNMVDLLQKVVTEGTGKKAKPAHYTAAGKTGTAYAYSALNQGKAMESAYDRTKGAAHFIGFAPALNPRVLVYVVIESPEESCVGGRHAAPVFSQIAEEVLQYLKVKPSKT